MLYLVHIYNIVYIYIYIYILEEAVQKSRLTCADPWVCTRAQNIVRHIYIARASTTKDPRPRNRRTSLYLIEILPEK